MRLLEIDTIRDIRLATKALMGLPQHWLQPDVVEGVGAGRAHRAPRRGVNLAIHTHVNAAQSVTPLVAEATMAMLEAGVRDVRNQGVLMRGRQRRRRTTLLDLCFALQDGADDHAVLLLHVRHDPVQRALAGLVWHGPGAAARDHGLPARLRDAADRLRRPVRRQALGAPADAYDRVHGISVWTKNYRTSIELDDPEALTRTYPYYDPIDTLPEEGQAWWRENTEPSGSTRRPAAGGRQPGGRPAQASPPRSHAHLTAPQLPRRSSESAPIKEKLDHCSRQGSSFP